jgi:hypothetical protein
MSSTLAGNLTPLGSVANLIVVENARKEGVPISYWEYCRVGLPVTLRDADRRHRLAGIHFLGKLVRTYLWLNIGLLAASTYRACFFTVARI